jgi:hypothetical protein
MAEIIQTSAATGVPNPQSSSPSTVVIPVPMPEELAAMSKGDIQKLETELDAATAAALAKAKNVLAEKVKELKTEEITRMQSFRNKHGISLQVAVVGTALLLGILGRVLRL